MSSIHGDVSSVDFDMPPALPGGYVTEEEYLAWCGEEIRAEWVDGKVIVMAPDSTVHSRLSHFLHALLND